MSRALSPQERDLRAIAQRVRDDINRKESELVSLRHQLEAIEDAADLVHQAQREVL